MRVVLCHRKAKVAAADMCLPSWNAMVRKLSIPLVKIPDHTEPHDHIWPRVRGEVGGKRWSNRPRPERVAR